MDQRYGIYTIILWSIIAQRIFNNLLLGINNVRYDQGKIGFRKSVTKYGAQQKISKNRYKTNRNNEEQWSFLGIQLIMPDSA